MLAELVAGVVVVLAALALVLEPLLRPSPRPTGIGDRDESGLDDIEESESPKIRALLVLREIEFDRATGKLSDEDYAMLKAKYGAAAVEAIKAEAGAAPRQAAVATARPDDPAEAMVRRFRQRGPEGAATCPSCGPRPEPGAAFCSNCGRSLVTPGAPPRCYHCGGELPEGAKFCSACGERIAA
jgi:hypothetical protein